MATKSGLAQIPFPGYLNTDTPAYKQAPEATPVLKNVVTRALPNRLTVRNGIKSIANWPNADDKFTGHLWSVDAPAGYIPYHAFLLTDGRYLVMHYGDHTFPYTPRYSPYHDFASTDAMGGSSEFPGQISHTNGYIVVDVNADETYYAGAWESDGGQDGVTPWGQPAHFDNCTFVANGANQYQQIGRGNVQTRYYDSTGVVDKTLSPANMKDPEVLTFLSQPVVYGGYIETSNFGTAISPAVAHGFGTQIGKNYMTLDSGTIPSTSYVGHIIRVVDTHAQSLPPYRYLYRIKKHDSDAWSVFYLDHPFGLGEDAAQHPQMINDPGEIRHRFPVNTAPLGTISQAVFRERLFNLRTTVSQTATTGSPQNFPIAVGDLSGYYGNAISWSKVGDWNKWRDQDFALVDGDASNPLTAMATLGDKLILFRENQMIQMTGYDEDSFVFQTLSDTVGCPYAQGWVVSDGVLYFASRQSIYAFDGEQLVDLMEPNPQKPGSIASLWHKRVIECAPLDRVPRFEYFWPTLAVTPSDHLIVVLQDIYTDDNGSDLKDSFVCDLQTGSWSTWGYHSDHKEYNPYRVVSGVDGRVFGVHKHFVSELTYVFDPDAHPNDYLDELPSKTTDAVQTYGGIEAEFDIYAQLTPGATTRIRELQVDHGTNHYWGPGDNEPQYLWTIKMGVDPDFTLGTEAHKTQSRWVGYTAADLKEHQQYTERFMETLQREGQTIRFNFYLDTEDYADYINPQLSPEGFDLFGFRVLYDRTRIMGVDNSV